MAIFRPGPHNGGVECKGVWRNRDFRPIPRFISEMIQIRAIVILGRWIWNRIQAFEWCHFQWSWVTQQNIQWHEASRGLSATAGLLVWFTNRTVTCLRPTIVVRLITFTACASGSHAYENYQQTNLFYFSTVHCRYFFSSAVSFVMS